MRIKRVSLRRGARDGMTLVEVVIAIGLGAMLSVGMYGSAIYTMRQTAKNVEHIFAVQLASSEAAAIRASSYNKLTADPATLTSADLEKRFTQTRTVAMDPKAPATEQCQVTYDLTGFGPGLDCTGGLGATYLNLPATGADWKNNQYKGHLLVIVSGDGANQVMYITSHKKSKNGGPTGRRVEAVLTSDLTGATSTEWKVKTPGATSEFAVDYGMYGDVTVSWGDGQGYKSVTETVYVPSSQ